MIHIMICDDERVQIDCLAAAARGWAAARSADVAVSEFESAEALLFAYEANRSADILLLDIQMKGMDGVALARRIRKGDEGVQIVFVTGYPDHMAEGYDVSALHYLMKPVDEKKLFEVLDRAARRRADGKRVLFQTESGTVCLRADEIASVEAFDHRLEVATARERYAVRMPLCELEDQLTEEFVRCHRSAVANLRHIRRITRTEVVLDSGRSIPLSRRMAADVNRAMIRYLKGVGEP